jgi:DeoR family transcriptional regulator, suf operon transcriptional repressor
MRRSATTLAGYHGLRGELLIELKKAQPLTAKELAERFGVTANALRRHLKALEQGSVVRYRREVRGVGGPVYAYSLTERGEALFPQEYAPLLTDALEMVRETQGSEGITRLFRRRWAEVAAAEPTLASLPLTERARLLSVLLTEHGYMAEAEAISPTEATIREYNCAVRAVAERFPEVCAAEVEFLREVLGGDVERRAHIVGGCNACEYRVRLPAHADG